jgi:hypothetical protein
LGSAENGTSRNQSAAEEAKVSVNRTTKEASDNRATEEGVAEEPPSHVLRVAASEACWLRVELNGQVRDLYLEPGEERRFRFTETGKLLLGNAGGVALFLDGEKLSIQAESGEVKEISLP